MSDELSVNHLTEDELNSYRKEAQAVITFKTVYNAKDFEDNKASTQFKPEMAHQIFGDSESIFGYKHVSIKLYYMHNSAKCYLDLHTSEKIENYTPDDINAALNSWLPENYVTQKEDFEKIIKAEVHDAFYGEILQEFDEIKQVNGLAGEKLKCTYKITLCNTNNEEFKEAHQRFETFIVWFIDGANFIDLEDERWLIFYIYEEFQHPETKEIYRSPIGFCTAYKFFAYPDGVRVRISQFFILPTHQRRGLGSKLYNGVLQYLRGQSDVVDVTVEEPVEEFQKMRDVCDCTFVYNDTKANDLKIIKQHPKQISKYMSQHKICKKQTQRILDILELFHAMKNGEKEVTTFHNNIRLRIQSQNNKETKCAKRRKFFEEAPTVTVDPVELKECLDSKVNRYLDEIMPVAQKLKQIL